jgi:hypothetical protein
MKGQRPGPVSELIWMFRSDGRTAPATRSHFANCTEYLVLDVFDGSGV